ncbi:MAM and LDL-receptor class A domain-containing protein 2 [Trichonephila clavipes]|nr:MAM and LDL-receptor class A domain-containing protein 2 [Trichonephila clavipes]
MPGPLKETKWAAGYCIVFSSEENPEGSEATFESETFPPDEDEFRLTFYYQMSGKNLGTLKLRLYVHHIPPLLADLPDLRHRIETAVVARITSDTLNKVWDKLAYRLDWCRVTNRALVEHL